MKKTTCCTEFHLRIVKITFFTPKQYNLNIILFAEKILFDFQKLRNTRFLIAEIIVIGF